MRALRSPRLRTWLGRRMGVVRSGLLRHCCQPARRVSVRTLLLFAPLLADLTLRVVVGQLLARTKLEHALLSKLLVAYPHRAFARLTGQAHRVAHGSYWRVLPLVPHRHVLAREANALFGHAGRLVVDHLVERAYVKVRDRAQGWVHCLHVQDLVPAILSVSSDVDAAVTLHVQLLAVVSSAEVRHTRAYSAQFAHFAHRRPSVSQIERAMLFSAVDHEPVYVGPCLDEIPPQLLRQIGRVHKRPHALSCSPVRRFCDTHLVVVFGDCFLLTDVKHGADAQHVAFLIEKINAWSCALTELAGAVGPERHRDELLMTEPFECRTCVAFPLQRVGPLTARQVFDKHHVVLVAVDVDHFVLLDVGV